MHPYKVFNTTTKEVVRVATIDQAIDMATNGCIVLYWHKETREWLEL